MLACKIVQIKEADTRAVVHVIDAARRGYRRTCVRTVNTDILVILISQLREHLHNISSLHHGLQLTIAS